MGESRVELLETLGKPVFWLPFAKDTGSLLMHGYQDKEHGLDNASYHPWTHWKERVGSQLCSPLILLAP